MERDELPVCIFKVYNQTNNMSPYNNLSLDIGSLQYFTDLQVGAELFAEW